MGSKPKKENQEHETWRRPSIATPPTPGALERDFRKDLGELNSHLCLADIAIKRMREFLGSQPDHKAALRTAATKNGHWRLYTDHLSFDVASVLTYIAQIALLLSRLDLLCDRLRRHALINPKIREIAEGDFVRKTLFLILQSSSTEEIGQPLSNEVVDRHIDPMSMAVVDYYRGVRNVQMHDKSLVRKEKDWLLRKLESMDQSLLKIQFEALPSRPDEVTSKDALLCSKAIQSVAKALCRALVDQTEFRAEVKRRYGNDKPERRVASATNFLQQEFLLDKREANSLLFEMSWLV